MGKLYPQFKAKVFDIKRFKTLVCIAAFTF